MQRENKDKKGSTPLHRVNYEDHSLKFLDWVDSMGLERTFFGRWVQYLDDKLFIRRSGLVFLYCVVLSYLIFWQIEIPQSYEVGQTAQGDMISPIAFEMTDEISTEERRQKAEGQVGTVYDFDNSVQDRLTIALIRSFKDMRSQLEDVQFHPKSVERKKQIAALMSLKPAFESALGTKVSNYHFEWLLEAKFDRRIEDVILRNLSFWYQRKIVNSLDRTSSDTLVARMLSSTAGKKEYLVPRQDVLEIQDTTSLKLSDRRGIDRFSEGDRTNIEMFAKSLLQPNLTFNSDETSRRYRAARDAVIPVMIAVKKNQVIVANGSSIQPFHMAIFKEIEAIQSDRRKDFVAIALALVLSACVLVFFSYLRRFTLNKVKINFKDLSVMMVIAFSVILMSKIWIFVMDAAVASKFGQWLPASVLLFAAPVAAGPMMVGLLVTSGEVVWLFTAFLAICLGIMTEFHFPFMLVSLVGGIAAARGVFSCKTRNDIYWAGVRTGLVNAFLIVFVLSVAHMEDGQLLKEILLSVPAGFFGGIASSLIAMMFIPLLESVFNYTTDIKLLELSNLNHPLLKEMIVKAPGTYHHSMMVGSMVEAAAEEIGANPLLGKVMCYYHDIGKMVYPKYFIENQKPGQNPHDHISPFMSKTLLIAHVKDGVEMGMEYKLGKPIIDGVLQHHGTTLISYFYNKALDARQEDDPEFSEEEFRYPGPKPQFREAALCMLADSIEAAARSLDEPSPVRLQNIVRNVIQRKFSDGQLDECNLTLKDLSKVEAAFVRILLGIYHQRIDYPRSAGGGLGDIGKSEVKK